MDRNNDRANLVDSTHLGKELSRFIAEANDIIQTQIKVYEDAPYRTEGEGSFLWQMYASHEPSKFIEQIPTIIDSCLRGIIALMAENNQRLLNLTDDKNR